MITGHYKPKIKLKTKWKMLSQKEDGFLFSGTLDNRVYTVIVSGEVHNAKKYIHVSVASKNHMPSYKILCTIKAEFIGINKKAFMVFPEEKYHVNIHPFCLHLFGPEDQNVLPEFSCEGSI